MKLQTFLIICSLTLRIDSQSLKPTRTYNGYQPHSGQLYYNDNLPATGNNANLRGDYSSQTDTQQTQAKSASDTYLRAQQGQQNPGSQNDNQLKILNQPAQPNQNSNQNQNQYENNPYENQYSNQNQNGNNQVQPSLEVLPPLHGSQDHYATRQSAPQNGQRDEITVDNRLSAEVDPVPLTRGNVTQLDMRKASLVISHIGIFMMRNAKGNLSNVVVSPLSVVNMLALLQAGATGDTQRQISEALQLTPEMTAAAFQLMNADFKKRGTQHNVLKSASSIFSAEAFDLNTKFKNIAIQDFGSEVSRISFDDPVAAAQKINAWIASKTNNKIDKLVSPGYGSQSNYRHTRHNSLVLKVTTHQWLLQQLLLFMGDSYCFPSDSIGINTQLVLANAVYFKGLWETMFKPQATTQKEFHLSNGEKKTVPFMLLRSVFRCGFDQSINALVVVLPFEGKQYSLVILLPSPNASVKDVLASLNGEKLANYQNIRVKDIHMEIPKFTVRADTDLEPLFMKMGITKIFSPESELNNIGLYRTNSPQVSSAVHSATISIDEQGATAAASSVVAVVALSYDNPSVVFKADRPFLAVLWDNQLNMPLFMTQIEDPVF